MLPYTILRHIGKGYSSDVFLIKINRKQFVLKREKAKSPRISMVEKEAYFLKKANEHGIGPKLFAVDAERNELVLEFIDSFIFNEWLFEQKPTKKQLHAFIDAVLSQARTLDAIGLDHGQLAGKGKNILVSKKTCCP